MTRTDRRTDARLDELETRLAHQDQAMLELGEELYRQQQQIAQLETIARHLAKRLPPIDDAHSSGDPRDDVPPHY